MKAADLLADLIAHASVSDRTNEAVTRRVADWLGPLGFDCQIESYDDPLGMAKFNLVAHRPGGTPLRQGGGGLAYFAHTDVVPAVGWTGPGGDPFTAVKLDGKIYGRGACDMKGSLAAMITAASQINAQDQTAPLWIVCTADEETGLHGARRLAASDAFLPIAAAQPLAIIGEPTRLSVVHAHKGFGGFGLIAHGVAAHSSTGGGDNAVAKMVPVLAAVDQIGGRIANDPALRNNLFDPPTMTFNYGIHDRCTATNIVPERCEIWASYRTMPGVDVDWIDREVEWLAKLHDLELQIKRPASPMTTPASSGDVAELLRLSKSIGGPKIRVTTASYATDGAELTALSRRIVCGPGDIAQAHTAAEFIELDQLNAGVSLYTAVIAGWCTSSQPKSHDDRNVLASFQALMVFSRWAHPFGVQTSRLLDLIVCQVVNSPPKPTRR